MPITSNIDPEKVLTIFTVKGNPLFEEFMAVVKSFYDGDPTQNVLWHIDQASVWDLSGKDIQKLAQYAPRIDKSRAGAKTAFVASDELSKSLSNLFMLFGQSSELKIQIQIFKSMDEALAWIKAD